MTDTSSTATAVSTVSTSSTAPTPKFAAGQVVNRTFDSFPNGKVTRPVIVCQVEVGTDAVRYAVAPLPTLTGLIDESELGAL